MTYADLTIKDKNFIKRYLQKKRLTDAISTIDSLSKDFYGLILDFGGGDGELCRQIASRFEKAKIYCYEPSPELLEEAKDNLKGINNVIVVSSLMNLSDLQFDYCFCMEVFEHLPYVQTEDAINSIDKLLSLTGTGVIGVPNELFLMALMKGLFRMTRRYGEFDATFHNVLRATIGKLPAERPVVEIAPGFPYHSRHLGFDYRAFWKLLQKRFEIINIFGTPINFLSVTLNPEIYFVIKKN